MSIQSRKSSGIPVPTNPTVGSGCLGIVVLPFRVLNDIVNSLIRRETRQSMLILLASILVSCFACFGAASAISANAGSTVNTPIPTIDINAIQTKAMLDAWSVYTKTAEAIPTSTFTPTITALPTNTPEASHTLPPTPSQIPTNTPFPTNTIVPTLYIPTVPTIQLNDYGPSAICNDGTYSYSSHRRGTCSHHGGVAQWLKNLPP